MPERQMFLSWSYITQLPLTSPIIASTCLCIEGKHSITHKKKLVPVTQKLIGIAFPYLNDLINLQNIIVIDNQVHFESLTAGVRACDLQTPVDHVTNSNSWQNKISRCQTYTIRHLFNSLIMNNVRDLRSCKRKATYIRRQRVTFNLSLSQRFTIF